MALRCPFAWSSIAGAGGCPAGERGDAAAAGVGVAELLVFQGELADGADEGGDVGAELGEFLVLGGDCLPEPGDGGAEPGLVLVVGAAFLDALVELVLQVGVALGERVVGDACLDGEGDDGERAVGPLGSACQDAVHRGADPVALVRCGGAHPASFAVVMRVRSCLPAWSRSLVAVARSRSPAGWGTCTAWLSRASARSRSWVACWSVRAMLPQPGTQWSRLGVSLAPSRWHRARSRL